MRDASSYWLCYGAMRRGICGFGASVVSFRAIFDVSRLCYDVHNNPLDSPQRLARLARPASLLQHVHQLFMQGRRRHPALLDVGNDFLPSDFEAGQPHLRGLESLTAQI